MEMLGTASLAAAIPPERAITTTVRRSEIAAALSDPDGPAELVLDLTLAGADGGEERSSIGIGWSQDELEGLLGAAPGEEILLAFDRGDLVQAFAEVGAHGLRERALVVAVASVGALGSGTAIANAMPVDEGGSVVTPAAVTGVGTIAASDAPQAGLAAEAAAKAAHGEGLLAAARAATAGLSSTAAVATQSGLAAEAAAKAAHGKGMLAAESSASAVPSTAASVATQSGLAAEAAAKAAHGEGMLAAETSGASTSATTAGSTGLLSGIPAPSLSDDLLAGALLLTITGAAFTVRRRTGTMRPS